MDRKLLVNIIIGFCIFTQFTTLLANVTNTGESQRTITDDQPNEVSTSLSSTDISQSVSTINTTTTAPSVVVTDNPKRKKQRLKDGRPRRQGYEYGVSPPKYTIFDMCPPIATNCPECTDDGVQVPAGICDSVVLKVLAISPSQSDGYGRVCGKFGMLKLYGNFDEKEFRRLIRFSVPERCECNVKASALYFLVSPITSFLKDGLLFNQVVFSEESILISADRFIENEIHDVLNSCFMPENNPDVSLTYTPSPGPPPAPYVPPPVQPPAPYVPPHVASPSPYVPPPTKPPVPYVPPPVVTPAPYVPPPVPPPAPYVPPHVPPPVPYVPPPVPPPAPYVPPPVQPPAPYVPPPVAPPAPYVPPPVQPPAPYVPPPIAPPPPYMPPPTNPPAPYVPPPVQPPAPYVPPPVQPPAPYNPPPVQLPIETSYQVRPAPSLPIPSLPVKQHHRDKKPFLYPSLTKCLIPDTCPVCARLENAGDITGQYCVAGFTYLAVIRVPDASSLQGADITYLGSTCMNLRTNIVYDITRTRDPQIVVNALTTLLPTKCLGCFTGLSGPVIVLIMGQTPPVPPVAQLDASYQVYVLPVPATISLPSCDSYSMYGGPAVAYSLLPVAPQPYATNDCPAASHQTCPLCQNYPDTSFAHACDNGFAIGAELNLAGPYFTSQRLPAISVKTTTTYYSKSVEVILTDPPPIECIKGFFKIIQNIGLAPFNFPGEIIPFVSMPNCECLSQGFKRLLIFSSKPLIISPEGYLVLSNDINIAFLQPFAAFPTCGPPPPPPPVYIPPQPYYIPPHQVPPSPYARPSRVPLTYIPPPPPPPAYTHPTDPPPVYILPPDYIPPPVKEPALLPSPLYIQPQPATISPEIFPETQPPLYATDLPFGETIPPIIACMESGNSSCVLVDVDQDGQTGYSINVDQDKHFPPEFVDLNSIYDEGISVWAPSFEECLMSGQPSCPHSWEDSPDEKFEEFFCNAKTALLVAVGIDYGKTTNETVVTKKLTFIQPEPPYIGIEYDSPDNPTSFKVAVTRNKTMDRRIQQQDNTDKCYKEKVLVLSDLSNKLKPRRVVGTLDIYIPGFCDSEIFDKAPSYGILLSSLQPSDVKNPVQLTEDFTFIPLPEGRVLLPDCGESPQEKPSSGVDVRSEKFWVEKSPLESVICELSQADVCGELTTVQEEFYALPCDDRSAALVLIQNTSVGNKVGPNLEILETSYESGEKTIVLNVKSNIDDEDAYASQQDQYANDNQRCKYATVQILKDFSRNSQINEDDVLTIIGNSNCDNPIFKLKNEVVLLLSNELITPNSVIPLDSRSEVIGIPPGTTTISFCNAYPLVDSVDDTPSDELVNVLDESNDETPSDELMKVLDESNDETPSDELMKVLDDSNDETPSDELMKVLDDSNDETPLDELMKVLDDSNDETPSDELMKVLDDSNDETPSDELMQVLVESNTPINSDPISVESNVSVGLGSFVDEPVTGSSIILETNSKRYEKPGNIESYESLETSCKEHADDTCPVCEDIGSISPEIYCNSGLSLFAEVILQEQENENCTNGIIASLFDITVRNGVPEKKVHRISYTIPTHCSCPVLIEGGHIVLVLDESTNLKDELTISLSQGKYLYSTPLRTPLPSCHLEDSVQARSKYVDNVIVLDSPYGEMRKVLPELSNHFCPTIDHTCPVCRSMDDKELESLYCSSEEVLLVSKSKAKMEKPKIFSRIGKGTFTQHRAGGNYSLEMSIDKYDGACGLPSAVGNCNQSLDRFYYDAQDESCYDFTYTGCGGNTNNFESQTECENNCLVEDFCEEGVWDIKKIMKSSDNANYLDSKFHYALPEHCDCSQMFKGKKKGYLLSAKLDSFSSTSIQLSTNFHFIPLSKNQQNMQFHCTKDDKAGDSSENDLSDSEGKQTEASAKSEKKKKGFFSFG